MDIRKIEFEPGYMVLTDENGQKTKVDISSVANVLAEGAPVTPVQAELTTALTGADNDLVFTAVTAGTLGNYITIAYIDPGEINQELSVVVTGLNIVFNLATGGAGAITSTADDLKAALVASEAASALVTAADAGGDDGSGVVTAMAATALEGGVDGVPGAKGQVMFDDSALYVSVDESTVAVSNWETISYD